MNREDFLKNIDEYSNHRVLLWEALKLTEGDVIEFGSGEGSTPFLREYCVKNARLFFSFENNPEWAAKTKSILITEWDEVNYQNIGVLFIDHAPGERRKADLIKYSEAAQIVVIHDSEPKGWNASNYGVREFFHLYKYKAELPSTEPLGAWTTILSNTIDVSKLAGVTFEKHIVTP